MYGRAYCKLYRPLHLGKLFTFYENFSTDTFGSIKKRDIFAQAIIQFIPFKLLSYIPNPKMSHMRYAGRVMTDVARSLVKEKTEAVLQGKDAHDIMSILGNLFICSTNCHRFMIVIVKANLSEDESMRLSEDEMLAQMRYDSTS